MRTSDRLVVARSSEQPTCTRRELFRTGAAVGLAAVARPWRAAAAPQSGRIVYATWGGSWEEALRKAWLDPFTRRTGIDTVTVAGPDYGKIRAMVKAGRAEWDVAEVLGDFPIIGVREGLLEPIDWSIVKRSNIGSPEMATDYSVPQLLFANALVYNTKRFARPNHPKSWVEAWDVQRFPGKRAFDSKANGCTLEAALLADGAPADQLYPLDVDRALRSLDRIRDRIIWYDTGAQQLQYWKDEQAVLGLGWAGRVTVAREQGAPVDIEYNQSFLECSSMIIPKGAPNKNLAMQLLAYTVTADAQAAVCNAMPFGPVNPEAFKLISPPRAVLLAGGPQMRGKFIEIDQRWWADNRDSVQEKLNAWRVR
jgi:putative spermidine/putrescine transport system substrate-binding protein